MSVTRELSRRARLASLVVSQSVRFVSQNRAELNWRDAVFLPIVTAVFLSVALFAPDAFSEERFTGASPHSPVNVRK